MINFDKLLSIHDFNSEEPNFMVIACHSLFFFINKMSVDLFWWVWPRVRNFPQSDFRLIFKGGWPCPYWTAPNSYSDVHNYRIVFIPPLGRLNSMRKKFISPFRVGTYFSGNYSFPKRKLSDPKDANNTPLLSGATLVTL